MNNCPSCGLVRGFHNSVLQGCTCQWQMAAHEKSKIETVPAKGTLLPKHLNASYEGDDLYTGDQLRAAVAAEREECARMVERLGQEGYGTLAIAAALRQGGKQ